MSKRGFEQQEFESRLKRAQRRMGAKGLDALLLTTETEVRYFTGYLTRFWESPTRPWFLIVPVSGKPVAPMAQTWIDDICTWSAPDLEDDGVSLLADTLTQVVPQKGVIGIPDGHETHVRMPLADLIRVRGLVGNRRVTSDFGVIREVRMVKSAAEIEKIETACGIAARAFDRVPRIAGEGVPLDHVFRHFQMACLDEGADWVPYLAGGAEQGGYADVISPAHDRALVAGDVLMLDTGLIWDGYFCDYDRNWSVGRPSAAVSAAHAQLVEASDAAFEIARPGATASDLFHAMQSVLSRGGEATDAGRLGHGLGISLTEWPSLIPSDHTMLQEGMVLTLEPGIAIGDKIMVHEENIVVTQTGARFVSPRLGSEIGVI